MKGQEIARALAPGEKYDKYQVVSLLARGGRSFVYKAIDTTTDEMVTLQAFVARLDGHQRQRVREVGDLLAQIQHPNLARTLGAGVVDGRMWIASELIRGRSLEKELATRGPLPMRHVASIGAQIARGLAATHEHKLIHRSLKPSNVLILDAEPSVAATVKVLDAGLWTVLYGTSGGTLATRQMMAPEECDGTIGDARSDVYSLGVLLFQLLTGRVPFDAPTLNELKDAHRHQEPPRLRALKPAAEPMEAVVNRALLKRASDRFQTMAALAAALDEIGAAPEARLTLSKSESQSDPPPQGGTWQIVAPHESRTLVEAHKRRRVLELPPEPSPERQRVAPLESKRPPAATGIKSRRQGWRNAAAWIVAGLVIVAWVVVGMIAWSRR